MSDIPKPEVADVNPMELGRRDLEALLAGYGDTIIKEYDSDPYDSSVEGLELRIVKVRRGSLVDCEYASDHNVVAEVVTDRDLYVVTATAEGWIVTDAASEAYLAAMDYAYIFATTYLDMGQETKDCWSAVLARLIEQSALYASTSPDPRTPLWRQAIHP